MRIVTENNRRTKKEQTAPRCTKQNGSAGSLVAFRHRPTFRSVSDIAIFAGDFRRERGKFDVQFSLSRGFSSRASHLYETETGNCDEGGSVTIAVHRPKKRGKGLPVRESERPRDVYRRPFLWRAVECDPHYGERTRGRARVPTSRMRALFIRSMMSSNIFFSAKLRSS